MSSRKFLLVYNEKAGKGDFAKKLSVIENYFSKYKLSYKTVNILDFNNTVNIEDYDTVIAFGGDGTVLSVLPYVVNRNIKLGIIPCGTANLLAGKLGIPKNVDKAFNLLLKGTKKLVDVGKTGDSYFILRVGYGMDAEIVNGTSSFLKSKLGYLAYLFQGIKSAFNLSQKRFEIKINGKCLNVSASAVIVSNAGNMFSNRFYVATENDISDGKLDVFILYAKNLWEFLTVLFQIIFNRHQVNSKVFYQKTTNISIRSDEQNVHIDGEEAVSKSLDISLIPNGLAVIAP